MFLCNRFHFSAADFKFNQASQLSNTIKFTSSPGHCVWWRFMLLIVWQNYCSCETSLIPSLIMLLYTKTIWNLNDLLSVVLCEFFALGFLFFFALGSFSALSYGLYRCVNCFSAFVLFVRMEIIIIMCLLAREESQQFGREKGRRMVVTQSNCIRMAGESWL